MTPDELIAVIERGLDADEQKARACSGDGRWTTEDIATIGPNLGVEPREHMARHDPSRVLADVESKREILAQYDPRFGNDFVWHPILAALARPYLDREAP